MLHYHNWTYLIDFYDYLDNDFIIYNHKLFNLKNIHLKTFYHFYFLNNFSYNSKQTIFDLYYIFKYNHPLFQSILSQIDTLIFDINNIKFNSKNDFNTYFTRNFDFILFDFLL